MYSENNISIQSHPEMMSLTMTTTTSFNDSRMLRGGQPRVQTQPGYAAAIVLGLMAMALVAFSIAACTASRKRRLQEHVEQEKKEAAKDRIREALKSNNVVTVVKAGDIQRNFESSNTTPPKTSASGEDDECIVSGTQQGHTVTDSTPNKEDNNAIILPCRTGHDDTPRCVSATCAICLDDYKEGESVVWASNPECIHCFHEECFVEAYTSKTGKEQCTDASWPCPVCRQCFLPTTGDGIPRATTTPISSGSSTDCDSDHSDDDLSKA